MPELLDALRAERSLDGGSPQPPSSDQSLADLTRRSRDAFGVAPPQPYLDVLGDENGLNHNGLFLYGTQTLPIVGSPKHSIPGFVDTNLIWRGIPDLRETLVFAEGNMDLYVLDLPTGEFRVLDRVPGNLIERHASFEDLLAAAIRAHL